MMLRLILFILCLDFGFGLIDFDNDEPFEFDCSDKEHKSYHAIGCSSEYVWCFKSEVMITYCPANQYYNPDSGNCDYKENVPICKITSTVDKPDQEKSIIDGSSKKSIKIDDASKSEEISAKNVCDVEESCKFDSKQETCSTVRWKPNDLKMECLNGPVFQRTDPKCPISKCEEICDEKWPWIDRVCAENDCDDVRIGRNRLLQDHEKILLDNCPRVKILDCSKNCPRKFEEKAEKKSSGAGRFYLNPSLMIFVVAVNCLVYFW